VTMGWERYADQTIGINRFGTSAPGAIALEKLGINLEAVLQASRSLIKDYKTQ
jgi:transketolase